MKIIKVGVIGSGTIGSGIVQVCALAGYDVTLVDAQEEQLKKSMNIIDTSLDRQVRSGRINKDQKIAVLQRIMMTLNIEDAKDVDFVIEAIFENANEKKKIMSKLDLMCPSHCIIASNTSSLPITDLASATGRPDKVIGLHFMNPVPVIKGVELIRGRKTSEETLEIATKFVESINKIPTIAEDYAGFITSRLLNVYLNEAAYAVMDGNSPEEVDKAMIHCTNMPIGPCKLIDIVGIDVIIKVLGVLEEEFGDRFRCAPLLKQMMRAGELGIKSGKGFYQY